jgi:glutamine phosphoribosylpyrophosphate amidotransferase
MCGICGVLLFDGASGAVELTKRLMVAQKHLGQSSSGVAYLKQDSITVEKDTVAPDSLKTKGESWVAIGHGRLPSVGKVCKGNAHPFLACNKEFALVHNGTFTEHRLLKLLLNGKHHWEGETDSEVLCHTIEEYSPKIGLKKLLQGINGERLLLLFKSGEIWGKGDLVVVRTDNGFYVANEEGAIAEVVGKEQEVTVYETSYGTVFRIKGKKVDFWGQVKKEKRKLKKEKRYSYLTKYIYYRGKEEEEPKPQEKEEEDIWAPFNNRRWWWEYGY